MNRAEGAGFGALFRDYRHFADARLWWALALMLLGALAEGFGLLMIVPLASIAIGTHSDVVSRMIPWLSSLSIDARFAAVLGVFVVAMGLRSLLLFARDFENARLQAGYEASLRLRSAATLASRGWTFASRIGQAGMQSLLLNDVPRAAEAIAHFQQIAVSLAMLAVQLSLIAALSVRLAVIALAFLLLGSLASLRWMRRGVRSGIAIVETMEESAGSGLRLQAGLKAALAQGTVPAFVAEYRASLDRSRSQVVQFTRDYATAQQLAAFGAAIAAAILLFVGVRLLALPFPVLVAILVLLVRMVDPALALQLSTQRLAAFAPAFSAVERRLGKLQQAPAPGSPRQPVRWKAVSIDSVRFEHRPNFGLRNATMSLKTGEWLGVSGASGAGKTTLVDLVAGLLAPQAGAMRVDGRPLEGALLQRWRAGLAYVGQEGAVFNDSVRGNLLAEGAKGGDEALWAVLEIVGLAARIRAFPGGLDENVGEHGSRISGGERQRLVLARALLRQPTLLLLDEATAALDEDSEAGILQRFRSLRPRPAAIMVAHRESSLAHCDSTIKIQCGLAAKTCD